MKSTWLLPFAVQALFLLVSSVPAAERPPLITTLAGWKGSRRLEALRDPAALAQRPSAEAETWRAFWVEVDAALASLTNAPGSNAERR